MNKQVLIDYFNERPEQYKFKEGAEGNGTLIVEDLHFKTCSILYPKDIEYSDLNKITMMLHQGKNVEHITRVTGYFSKVSGWNKGKVAELVDRHRNTI